MGAKSKIEWTETTWNPIVGCSLATPGCTNCYAMGQAARIEAMFEGTTGAPHYRGLTEKVNGNAVWTGRIGVAQAKTLTQPLRWKRPRLIFVNSMGDLFYEGIDDTMIDAAFATMALAQQHTFQVLTKRSARMRAYFAADPRARIKEKMWAISGKRTDHFRGSWPLDNVWLGVSTERQQEADERIPELLTTPAAVRFISAEPLLGPVDLTKVFDASNEHAINSLAGRRYFDPRDTEGNPEARLDWVIVGGESGRNARPMHPEWARALRDQCKAAGVPFFFKQWGEWIEWHQAGAGCWSNETKFDRRGHPTTAFLGSLSRNGEKLFDGGVFETRMLHPGNEPAVRVGKKAAGRLLDGVEHNEFPKVATC